jgi:hypothetical protein
MTRWIKYYFIIMIGLITNKTVVSFLGSSYAISGNVVRKLGDTK